MSRDDNDSLGWTKLDRRARAAVSPLAGLYMVSPQHALGAMLFFWDSCGERKELERLLADGVRAVVLDEDTLTDRLRVAWGCDVRLRDFIAAGFLAVEGPGKYRVRGMSRYFEAIEASNRGFEAASKAGKASAAARKAATGTAQPTKKLPNAARTPPERPSNVGRRDAEAASASASAFEDHHQPEPEKRFDEQAQSVAHQTLETLEDLRDYVQSQRVLVGGNTREEAPSRKVRDEQQARFDDLGLSGVTGADFRAGCERYLLDPYWATRSPPHPFAGFLARWSQWAPKKPRLAFIDVPVTPAEQAWKAQLDQVGEGQPYASHTLSKGLELVGLDGEALVVRTDDPFFAVWARTYLPPEVRIESPPMPAEPSNSRETMPVEASP